MLLRILGGLLAVVLLLGLAMFLIPLTEGPDQTRVEGSADWMARLDDNLSLSEITLPGTHDCATQYVQLAFFSKCQSMDITGQLEAGARYLDIRLGFDGDRVRLMHGFTNCKTGPMPWSETLYLEDVLAQCAAFLTAHPTETVLFAVKYEHGDDSMATLLDRLNSTVFAENPELWLLTDHIPTLGEARGRLVFLGRYIEPAEMAVPVIPLNWPDQKGNEDTGKSIEMTDNGVYRLWVQDRFEYGTEHKWAAFAAGLACPDIGPGDVSIHFLSTKGTLAYGHPFAHAMVLNPRLESLPQEQLRGWIVVDFLTAPLAQHIYETNFS